MPKKPTRPTASAKNETGEFDRFMNFMQRLMAVPHSEVKAKLDAEKREKKRKRTPKTSAFGASSDHER